ncbi:MAG: YfiR family protein [Candidatus Aminicenantes bacterium]
MSKMVAEVSRVRVPVNKVLAAGILFLLFTINVWQAQPLEYKVKALLLQQIADKHIDWPKETGMDKLKKPFVIGVIGENSFGAYLEQIYNRKQKPMKIKNKVILVRNIKRIEQISGCHLLFISELPRRFFFRVIESVQDKPILTVADTTDYLKEGIHIGFVLEDSAKDKQITEERKPNIGLVINETAARQSGLRISQGLLNMATNIVNPYRPYQEKASYLESFSRFIDWPPPSAADTPSKHFKIEILGENDFGSYLDKIFKRKKLKDKSVVIRYISEIEEIDTPHILFISKSLKKDILKIVAYTKKKPILTIGDTPGFHQAGVHINFFYDRLKLSFEINEKAARKVGLRLYYHLLKMAKTNTSNSSH